jgi:protein O-GlcNAc transferase
VQAGGAKLEAQVVMGEALRQQSQWAMAAAAYGEILEHDEFFPEAQTKLSFVLYRLGDPEGSLKAARAALAATPNNAEAHKNAGLALGAMEKFDTAAMEYHEALQIKPDYESVHFDLGILLNQMNDIDGSISEYQTALKLNPNDVNTRINLSLDYSQKNDGDAAIRELREQRNSIPRISRCARIWAES